MMDDGAGNAAGGRFARGLIRLTVGALLLVLALLAAMRLLNWRDDALRPEVMSAAKFTPPDAEAMRRNGFFTLLGLDAPPDQDAHAAGERAYAQLTAQLAARRQRGEPHRAVSTLAFTHLADAELAVCGEDVRDCYADTVSRANAVRALLDRHALLVSRYLSLGAAPDYLEIVPPDHDVAEAVNDPLRAASALVSRRAALAWHGGRRDEALALLATNAQIHRRLWAGARLLAHADEARALDAGQTRVVAGLLDSITPDDPTAPWTQLAALLDSPPQTLAPLLAGQRDAHLAKRFMDQPQLLINLGPEHPWLQRLVDYLIQLNYLPNATRNAVYDEWQPLLAQADVPMNQLPDLAQALPSSPPPFRLRNAFGLLVQDSLARHLQEAKDTLQNAKALEAHRRQVRQSIASRQQMASARTGARPVAQ